MMYNQVLGSLSNQESVLEELESDSRLEDSYYSKSMSTSELYDNLQSLVLSTARATNPKFDSAIFMIDPGAQEFTLQRANSDDFSNLIPVSNQVVNSILQKNETVYQKDTVESWNQIFESKPWRGSECVIGSSITLNDSVAGFVITRIEHFSEITDNNKAVLETLGDFISFGIESLESLEKNILKDENKSRILEMISDLNFKSDESQIMNHFKNLIRTFFQYSRLTISLKNEVGINSTIKVVDGIKDAYLVGAEFPTNGSLHGLPAVSGEMILTQNWREKYTNLSRFSNDESETEFYSVMGVPIIIQGENRGSLILERLTNIPFTESDQQTCKLIGQVLGSALHWVVEYEKIY